MFHKALVTNCNNEQTFGPNGENFGADSKKRFSEAKFGSKKEDEELETEEEQENESTKTMPVDIAITKPSPITASSETQTKDIIPNLASRR